MTEVTRVRTFNFDGGDEEGEISRGADERGFFDVLLDSGRSIIRHRDHLVPLDEEARRLLGIEK